MNRRKQCLWRGVEEPRDACLTDTVRTFSDPRSPRTGSSGGTHLTVKGCIFVRSLHAFDDAEVTLDLPQSSHKIVILSGAPHR